MGRLRRAPRGPLAVAAVLSTPLFFAALMAMSLAVEKPSISHGQPADPSGSTELAIWLLAFAPAVAVVLVGVGAMLLGRAGVAVTALAAIAAAAALMLPLDGWAKRHSERYPIGVDLIAKEPNPSDDIYLPGEWEASARHTALQ